MLLLIKVKCFLDVLVYDQVVKQVKVGVNLLLHKVLIVLIIVNKQKNIHKKEVMNNLTGILC